MKHINLSEWALEHPSMVLYLIIVLLVGGVLAFFNLGRAEDPDFTFKVMVVRTQWPGATAAEVESELTERIEKKLQETPYVDVLKSASRAGESLVFIILKDYTPKAEVPESWRQVRKKLDDIKHQLPPGVQGPFPNDEFGDVYVNIYALSGDGYDMGQLRREADRLARELRAVPDVKKVDLLGVQDEKIYVEVAPAKLASLGLTPAVVAEALAKQNAVAPAGFVETASDRVRLRVTGGFDSVERIRNADLAVGGRTFRLGDIAEVKRGLADPPSPRLRVAGKDAVGIAVAMTRGGNAISLGGKLKGEIERLSQDLPLGMEVATVADQPAVAQAALKLFLQSLGEALVIVLAVSFLSLGFRTGLVVALSIPLVLAMTFLLMKVFGIDLHRISLGALIIALGTAGRRRHHRRRDDGGENRAGLGKGPRRHLRLYFDRVPDADRHADHRGRLHAGRLRQVRRGRVRLRHLRRHHHRAADLVDRRRGVHALSRLQAARREGAAQVRRGASRGCVRHAFLQALPRAGGVVPAPALDGDRADGGGFRAGHGGLQHRRAEAVLPAVVAARAAGRSVAAAGGFAQGHGKRRETRRDAAQGRRQDCLLLLLHRQRRAAFLPAARPATVQRQLRPAGDRDQGLRRTRGGAQPADGRLRCARRFLEPPACPRAAAGERAAGRLPGGVPGDGRGLRDLAPHLGRSGGRDARQPQRARRASRLEREGQGGPRRDRPGPRPRARRFQPGRGAGPAGAPGRRDADPVSRRRPADRHRVEGARG